FVGVTGSGRTTLARLVTRFADPVRGTVRINGVDVREAALEDLRERVVVVPQEGFLFTGTIASNVAYGRQPHPRERVEQAFAELGLLDWLATLPEGMDTDVGQRGESLSAGERRSEEHTSELQSRENLVCRRLLEKK